MGTTRPAVTSLHTDVHSVDQALTRATQDRLDTVDGTPRHRALGRIIDRLLDERVTLTRP